MVKRLESPLCRVSGEPEQDEKRNVHTTTLVRARSCHAGESHCTATPLVRLREILYAYASQESPAGTPWKFRETLDWEREVLFE
jgi:hypothetical protein